MKVEITPIYEAWTNNRKLLVTWGVEIPFTQRTRFVKVITIQQETLGQ